MNYTPLDTDKLYSQKKSFKLPNKILVGLILFFTLGVGALGFLLTRESLQTSVPAQVDTTISITPNLSPTIDVSITDTPPASTDEAVLLPPESTSSDGATVDQLASASVPTEEPTEIPTETPEPTLTEEPTPTEEIARGGAGDPTPTEIILAQGDTTSGDASQEEPTDAPAPSEVPAAGVATYGFIFGALALTIIFFGLVF